MSRQVAKIIHQGIWTVIADGEEYRVYYQYHDGYSKHKNIMSKHKSLSQAVRWIMDTIEGGMW